MIKFDSFREIVGLEHIDLSADLTVIFDSADCEDYSPGTPSLWDEYLLSKIDIENYDVFHLFAYIIDRNKQNRITDWKKVWGLSEITEGQL